MAKRKPGKYDHLLHKLKPLPPEDLAHQERVDEMKKQLRVCPQCKGADEHCQVCYGSGRRILSGNSIATLYINARAEKEMLEQAAKDAGLEVTALEQLLVASQEQGESDWGAFGASDRTIKLATGDSVRVQPEVYASPVDKHTFRNWCYANGFKDKMELPEKPRLDMAKERLLNGLPEASGLELYVRKKIVYTPMKTETVEREESEVF